MMLLNPMTLEAKSLMILLMIPNVWPANRFFCISYFPTDISAADLGGNDRSKFFHGPKWK